MKNSKRFRDYTLIKKVGLVLMLSGAAIILIRMLGLLPANEFVSDDFSNYLYLIGAVLFLLPYLTRMLKGNRTKAAAIIAFGLMSSLGTDAQDYSRQVATFEQAFAEKSIEPMKPYVSPQLKFDPVPAANTPAVLANIVSNLPKLNSMTITATMQEKVKVKYDFVTLGIRESFIHFDADGKFLRIELVENLIQMEIKAQQRLKESVQQPPTTELAKKFIPKQVEFAAADGLIVSGDLYEIGAEKPVILLSHQAGYNRVEYLDIAPKLNELGFNCLALDLRSGGDFAGKNNKTAQRAIEKGLQPSMLDAQQDIAAAIEFLHNRYGAKITLWGSSFSASLSLLEGAENKRVTSIIAFSPGDYFGEEAPSIATAFKQTKKPFLVTSSKEEASTLTALISSTSLKKSQLQFIPESEGFHGSKTLWTDQKGAEEYWEAVLDFLTETASK